MESEVIRILAQFDDPRDSKKVKHPLSTVLFISICAVFCGAEGWEDVVLWAEAHIDWLSKYVDMSNGVPSYSTVRRMFMIVSPACFGQLIKDSITAVHPNKLTEDHVPIDGKTMRGSKCVSKEIRAMQMVSAWSVENNIILGEVKTDSKSNEITAIPLLLDLLELEGATISIDAIGCNEKIISHILKKEAHYLIGLKKNQPKLYAAVEAYAQNHGTASNYLVSDYFDNSHGRSTCRRYFTFDAPKEIKPLGFNKMNTIICNRNY